MKNKTGGNRGLRRAGALSVVAAVAVLATACGSSDPSPAGGSVTFAQEVALAQCMRTHGVPGFPDPSASGGFHLTTTTGSDGAVDIDSSQVQTAYGACRHLLSGGGPNLSQLQQQVQQKQQQALPGLVAFAQCMRGHGVPGFPDPTANGFDLNGSGINPASPQLLAATHACQHALPSGMHMTVGTQGTRRS